ncbi:alpha-ketoacid dehydrogenase subunit beta [Pseudoflavonifractor sp. MCC625]|uniref:alpha-ketoacid dehydrogenase subunit beta n=1 Tax=Pseudoflavonifractor sp. MCC625 TaxID=2592647 RepID=UPI001C022C27|nr:alpha-ketoacid dehydrogenase subunit beta [Pseudoflavonifractor sp. MCC625]MBT9683788.1 alpha-ketoacid dehydrogenase subunit beta [Pseudoflavonifractor sp. MCC625]
MPRKLSFSKALNEALHQSMERDENVFIIGEDVAKMGGDFGITQGIWQKWPERAYDTPLSEQAIIGLCSGAAALGLRPVAEIMFADFLGVCFDQIVNNAAKMNFMYGGEASAAITVRASTGGGIRCAYHHSQCVEPWLMNIPGLVVVAPSTPYEAKGLLNASIRDNNPVIFLEHKGLYNVKGEVPQDYYELPLYQAEVKRQGSDVTVVATMMMTDLALKAAEQLAQEGISVEVIDPRTLFPLDKETIIQSVGRTGRLVVVQEGPQFMGFGAELGAIAASEELFEYLKAPVKRVTSEDVPTAYAPCMEDFIMPNLDKVLRAIRSTVEY